VIEICVSAGAGAMVHCPSRRGGEMSDNEYLAQVAVHERLRDARARAAVARCVEGARAAGAPRTGEGRRRSWWLSRAYERSPAPG
jgi:hypothetical protein